MIGTRVWALDSTSTLTNICTTPTRSAIRTEALRRTFNEVTAVDGIDLDISTGEIYGFLGPNGAGKTLCFAAMRGRIRKG